MTYDLNITFDDNLVTGNNTIDTQHKETFVYRMIVTPLTMRLKRDKATADKLYEELLQT